jgi:lipid A 3-O-deacylase
LPLYPAGSVSVAAAVAEECQMKTFGAALALVCGVSALALAAPAAADEIVIGGFAHDTSFGVSGTPHESGTADIQLMYRSKTFHFIYLLNPMVYAKAQINTSGLTNFYTVGLEWRHHFFHSRFYGDAAVGGAYVDGYNTYPDHFQSGELPPPVATPAQLARYQYDLHIYNTRKAMGSDFVFNPNFAIGYDISNHFAVEAAWDHYSNAGLGGRNPGMDTFGGRLVYRFGGLY